MLLRTPRLWGVWDSVHYLVSPFNLGAWVLFGFFDETYHRRRHFPTTSKMFKLYPLFVNSEWSINGD